MVVNRLAFSADLRAREPSSLGRLAEGVSAAIQFTGSPSNALIFFLLVPSWLVSSVTFYSAGPDVDHADLRQQRSRLNLDCQRGPRHPLR